MPYVTGEERERLLAAAVSQYGQGKSIRQIADGLGYSYGAVHAMLKQAGVNFRDRGYHPHLHGRRKQQQPEA